MQRALRHHNVTELDRTAALEEAVYRVFLAHQRAGDHLAVVAGLLECWLDQGESAIADERQQVGEVIDRLVTATQLRFPSVGDLTRSIRFQLFEQPIIEQSRKQAYAGIAERLDHLDADPDADDRAEHIDAMVDLTEPVVRLLGARLAEDCSGAEPLLEVLTRRYYRVRTLEDVRSYVHDDRQFVTGSFDLSGQQLHLIATVTDHGELAATVEAVSALARDVDDPANLVVDLYVAWDTAPADSDELAESLRGALADAPLVNSGRRVTVTVFDQGGQHKRSVTFRPSEDGLREDRVIRDMHPLTGQRLDLWRLKNFDGTRLPSPDNTYLFHCVAKDNPDDERLVALAEIRDANPLRDADGQITAFPAVERALAACLDGIRRHQSQSGAKRLDANRIFLYVWPTIEVPADELGGFARAAAPLTAGAGLEEVMLLGRLRSEPGQEPRDVSLLFSYRAGTGVGVSVTAPPHGAAGAGGCLHPEGAAFAGTRHRLSLRVGQPAHR